MIEPVERGAGDDYPIIEQKSNPGNVKITVKAEKFKRLLPIKAAHEESQNKLWNELFEDLERLSYSTKLASQELPNKWNLTRKQP